eukprot:CAMPEP_0113537954 /NCGR_PEP_ID=MMETSP0015_2-20120614/7108_1 /TAXON_ID=2838 /ORGANISM="Odontella" /LENGTH=219 /DNA_ID=CAMNT_0000437497 /DNA_START=363 /DNA_END=1019 /DNA_ORIENTATION=+ /assembly_acc=CAM_ASM_000160
MNESQMMWFLYNVQQINVRDGSFDDLGGLDPTLSWSASSSSGDVDLEYGVEASARPTADIASLPRKIWGTAKTTVGDWGVTARADLDAQDLSSADIEVDANNADADLSVHLEANAGDSFSVNKIEATKGIDSDDSRITVTPRYDLNTEEADVVVAYASGDTDIEVTASRDAQSIKISQQIDDENRVSPTLASSGDISVEWERKLGDDSSLTTTLTPNDS